MHTEKNSKDRVFEAVWVIITREVNYPSGSVEKHVTESTIAVCSDTLDMGKWFKQLIFLTEEEFNKGWELAQIFAEESGFEIQALKFTKRELIKSAFPKNIMSVDQEPNNIQ